MDEHHARESGGTGKQAHDVCELEVTEARDDEGPEDGADRLYGEQHAHPVACGLVFGRCDIGGAPAVAGYGAVGVGPHIEECRPAEELHQAHGPEGLGGLDEELQQAFAFLVFRLGGVYPVELRILLGRHLLDLEEGVEYARDEDGGSEVETVYYAVGDDSLGGGVGDSYPGEEDGEEVAHQAAGVAQEALDAVGGGFLLLAYHVADHHLEWLHGHVDGGVKEDEREEAEPHGGVEPEEHPCAEMQRACIGQEHHYEDCYYGAYQKVRLAASHAGPGAVGPFADERLDYHAHEGREYPEERQLVRIGAKRSEYTADVGALQRVCNLHSEETETQVEHLSECQVFSISHLCGYLVKVTTNIIKNEILYNM